MFWSVSSPPPCASFLLVLPLGTSGSSDKTPWSLAWWVGGKVYTYISSSQHFLKSSPLMRYIFISSHQCTLAKLKFTSSNCHLCFLFAAFCVLPLKYVHVLLRLWLFPFLIFHPFYLLLFYFSIIYIYAYLLSPHVSYLLNTRTIDTLTFAGVWWRSNFLLINSDLL